MSDESAWNEEPSPKKLRSASEPDLKVLVGEERAVLHLRSAILATHSDYVDTLLASPMSESVTRELSFSDITPAVFQKMLALLEDPSQIRRTTLHEVLQVLPFYDKYQFPKGKQLCSDVITEFLEALPKKADLDSLVDVVTLADEASLSSATNVGVQALKVRLETPELRIMFVESQIIKLVPLIKKEELLLDAVDASPEEILSPLFPRYLIQSFRYAETQRLLHNCVPSIELACDGFRVRYRNGVYGVCSRQESNPDYFRSTGIIQLGGGEGMTVVVQREDTSRNWVVYGQVGRLKTALWVYPQSSNMDLPPRRGWVAADPSSMGQELTVGYVFRPRDGDDF